MAEVSQHSDTTLGDSSKTDGESFHITRDFIQITTVKFDGGNYLTWSKSVLIFIQGKDKEEYITSEAEIPPKKYPDLPFYLGLG